jgi:hypothetical protein
MIILSNDKVVVLCPACQTPLELTNEKIDIDKSANIQCNCGEKLAIVFSVEAYSLYYLKTNMEKALQIVENERLLLDERQQEVIDVTNQQEQ